MSEATTPAPAVSVGRLDRFRSSDLHDLCDAAELAILEGGGFGWVKPPPRETMERYWGGVVAMPGRHLFVGRLDEVVAGAIQLVEPPVNNEAQSFAAGLSGMFVAPWARDHGLARMLAEAAEVEARARGYGLLTLDVRETQTAAIHLFESLGFVRWATNPYYARVNGRLIGGCYFHKPLIPPTEAELDPTP
ncbi:GNAT family N-acetyltransferase [Mycobacterium sp. KBS0706]|uniref:GNAT family N-acetyltransferase n=1 Tax=Mycobacterium sp. KBS0706 TaxID=2578109 RepID=UPI00110FB520|nr:GNAT family N-acetyltransferase [Mycobacterium sp. KBS0706]TSD89010.1 GNAT family N-acetyltransferase [Mycobacterium sp. KBS0706]